MTFENLKHSGVLLSSIMLAAFPVSSAWAENLAHEIEETIHVDEVEHHGGGSQGLPQFDITTFPSQIFWLFVAFLILYIYFSKKTLPDLSSVMERRRNLIESELETAENKRRETEKLKNDYEESIREAVVKSKETLTKAKDAAAVANEKAASDFQKKAEKATLDTTQKANKAKDKALGELNEISAEVAVVAVEKITGLKVSDKDALSIISKKNSPKAKAA